MKSYTRLQAAKHFGVKPWQIEAIDGVGTFEGIREFWRPRDQLCGGPCVYRRDVTNKRYDAYMKKYGKNC